MAAVIERPYVDPDGNYVMGYVIDNKTYKDPYGRSRIDPGSQVLGDDGSLYRMTENGGVRITGGSAPASEAPAQAPSAVTRPYIDPDGNYVMGYVIDNKTYKDPYGQNRVDTGSQVLGNDGTLYQMTENGGVAVGAAGRTPAGGTTTPSAASAEQYIRELYAARREATLRAYKTAYDASMSELAAAAEKLPAQYQRARNQAAASSEIQRANFNEYAAANGLSSGAGGQAVLAMGGQLQSSLSGIGAAEADALSDLELQRTRLAAQYQNDIARAIADGQLQEASALYNDYVRVDDALVRTAGNQAGRRSASYCSVD
jgi:hypothetical protein